jgi:hypothetical protein
MNTNALFALGFLRKGGDSYDRSMRLCGEMTKISIQYNEYTDDWGISFSDGNIYVIGDVDEILDFVADYVENKGKI